MFQEGLFPPLLYGKIKLGILGGIALNIYQVETLTHTMDKVISKTIFIGTDYQKAMEIAITNKKENVSVWFYTWENNETDYKGIEEI